MGNKNINLYFKGFIAGLIKFAGFMTCVFSAGVLIYALLLSSWGYGLFGGFGLTCGIGIIIYGNALRFDYQRKSGTIIHKEDWRY